MNTIEIFHNPRCSKSRQTLSLLEEKGLNPTIIKYLETPPDQNTLEQIIKYLGIAPRDLLRKGEPEYKMLGLSDQTMSDKVIIEAMVNHPKLIERPIVIKGNKARIGRPPEAVLEII